MVHDVVKYTAAGVAIGSLNALQSTATQFGYYSLGGEAEKNEFDPDVNGQAVFNSTEFVAEAIFKSYYRVENWLRGNSETTSPIRLKLADAMDSSAEDLCVPLYEEVIFRGVLQPLGAKIISTAVPALQKKSFMGIEQSGLISAVAMGCLFGYTHMADYNKGGLFAAADIAISGCIYGITKERFGFLPAYAAHVTTNLVGRMLNSMIANHIHKKDQMKTLEWNNTFIEFLKEGKVDFDCPFWSDGDFTSDIESDLYLIAAHMDDLSEETMEQISNKEFLFEQIRELVMQNGYATNEAISARLIELYTEENEEILASV